jgi:PAS domain S-box-containing protein
MLATFNSVGMNDPIGAIVGGAAPPPQRHSQCSPLAALVEHLPRGVLIFDAAGNVVTANREASAILACQPQELLGQAFQQLLPDLTWPAETTCGTAGDLPGACRTLQSITATRRNGAPVPLEASLTVAEHDGTRFVVVSMVDISARQETHRRLIEIQAERLAYLRVLADISGRLARVEPCDTDAAIAESLARIGETLRLDQVTVCRQHPDEAQAEPLYSWMRSPPFGPPDGSWRLTLAATISGRSAPDTCMLQRVDDVPDGGEAGAMRREFISTAALRLPSRDGERESVLAVEFAAASEPRIWPFQVVERLRLFTAVIAEAVARQAGDRALQNARAELQQLRDVERTRAYELRRGAEGLPHYPFIIANGEATRRALAFVAQVSPTPATVLLLGETGVGKEVFAQAIHDLSPRHRRAMIKVNCAAIPSTLIESELFGREKGAFTGALSRQIGRFEAADHSTLFLDEIGEMPAATQVKLLRALQERVIERLGGNQPIKVDVRIIAATNRNLEKAVAEKTFREDLFYRLNVFPIVVPPLRERVEDIPELVWAFIDELTRSFGKNITSVPRETMLELQRYPWPGNVRELRNVIERAVILSTGRRLEGVALKAQVPALSAQPSRLADFEADHIRKVLDSTNWRVRGTGGAAERLGLKPTTLESRMARLGIRRSA